MFGVSPHPHTRRSPFGEDILGYAQTCRQSIYVHHNERYSQDGSSNTAFGYQYCGSLLLLLLLDGGRASGLLGWLSFDDDTGYLSLIAPASFILALVLVVVVVSVACRRRGPRCASKSSCPPETRRGGGGGGSAPTTSSVTTTTYLPAGALSGPANDEYTRCFVAARRLDSTVTGPEWTNGSPSVTSHPGLVGVVIPTAASSSPRQPLVTAPTSLQRADVKYHFYEEC